MMDVIAGNVIDGLSSLALEEFNLLHDLQENKKRMEKTVSAIKAVLLDAEANATSDHQVNHWLKELKEVLYDADDLLDDFSAEALARKVMTGSKTVKEVRFFFSKLNQVAYGHKMSRRMKEISKKLDDIADDKNKLQLIPYSSRAPTGESDKRQTYSFVREDEVVGRDEEKSLVVSRLLDSYAIHDLSIITIVGIGGMGKTCLAQLVYNDAAVENYFELKMWVCVSDSFDIREIGQKMVECDKNANIEQVQKILRNKIRGKRFLLVLDDVWNEERNLWLQLKSLLMEGGKGSLVIITTRSASVTRITDADMSIDLKGLDEKKSWELFSQLAFEEGKESADPVLVATGKEICKKCIGVPLAIKTMANLLHSRESNYWSFIRDSELLSKDEVNNKILNILRLSYDHLPSNLKNCFAYCSLFPKDYKINKKTIIQLWIAQGFIPLTTCPEDVGHNYFMNLLSRCFFQDVEEDEFGDIESCKMHDLMHDLATLVSDNECIIISEGNMQVRWDGSVILRKENKEIIGDRMRHLLMDVPWGLIWKVPTSLLEGRKLRTYFLSRNAIQWEKSSESSLPIPWGLKRLRVLHNPHIQPSTISERIGKLKHLRYLDLSWNAEIQKLPQSITRLHNLQTLKLNFCRQLQELPRDINKMVSLRHLELDHCYNLNWMPQGLGQLTSLQTMTWFSLNPTKSDSARLSELGGLNNLKGRLSIYDLQQVRGNAAEVESAKLFKKQQLQHLELYWWAAQDYHFSRHKEDDHHIDEMILQSLQPHHSIRSLTIGGCFIMMLPNSIRNLSSLQILCLDGLDSASIPDNIETLSSLQKLKISSCNLLEYMPESIGNLSSLQQLEIKGCKYLKSLPESIGNLSSLLQLQIERCCCLLSLPESIGNLSSMQQLCIKNSDHFASLPESIGNLSSLQRLELSNCNQLASLPDGMRNIISLQRLQIYGCPLLEERCKREEGEDWQKIAHVPIVSFDCKKRGITIGLGPDFSTNVQSKFVSVSYSFII